jgi:hypothetical protein
MVRLVAHFISELLGGEKKRIPCRRPERTTGEWFRTDAKGEQDKVVLGGWALDDHTDLKRCRWFSITLGKNELPWAFRETGSSWASTSLEVLAALVALVIFDSDSELQARRCSEIVLSSGTDNMAAESLTRKGSSTKLPLMMVLMQMAVTAAHRRIRLEMKWRPRRENQAADDLTNDVFESFDPGKRIVFSWSSLGFTLLDELVKVHQDFQEELVRRRVCRKEVEAILPSQGTKRKFEKSKW